MSEDLWSEQDEAGWRSEIESLFGRTLQEALQQYDDPLAVGDRLGDLLKALEKDAAKLVVPRAVRKWASVKNRSEWEKVLQDETMLSDLRAIGTSIANTMRPLAGNTFASWVSEVLNASFRHYELPMSCVTRGKIKKDLSRRLVIESEEQQISLKPDIDMVIVHVTGGRQRVPLAIVSAKTTLAERVMQTINWKRYVTQLPEDVRNIKLYLVTAWEIFPEGDVNRERVQELDGVYVCNTDFQQYGNIKPFSSLLEDLKLLLPPEATSSS